MRRWLDVCWSQRLLQILSCETLTNLRKCVLSVGTLTVKILDRVLALFSVGTKYGKVVALNRIALWVLHIVFSAMWTWHPHISTTVSSKLDLTQIKNFLCLRHHQTNRSATPWSKTEPNKSTEQQCPLQYGRN